MTLFELLAQLRVLRVRMLGGTMAGMAIDAMLAFLLTSYHRAAVALAPAADVTQGGGALSSLASRFGGLASFAGINLGATGTNRSAVTLEALRGHKFLVDFAKRSDLVVPLFAGRSWVAATECNLDGNAERANIGLVRTLRSIVDALLLCRPELAGRFPSCPSASGRPSDGLIEFVKERPRHDRRYALDTSKVDRDLGFRPSVDVESGLQGPSTGMLITSGGGAR